MGKVRAYIRPIFLAALAAAAAVIWYAVFYAEGHQSLLVTFFDVGQGDSIFVEVPDGNQILIDGGPSDRILAKLGRVMPFWDRSIDLLILTHPHADHLDGLLEVLKRYDVDMVLESGVEHSIPEYQEWRELLERRGIQVVPALVGERVDAGAGVTMEILSPFEAYQGVPAKNVHDANVASRLIHGENSFLFMGDAEKMIEYRLLFESPQLIDADILKVGHHGSKTSSSAEFLQAVSPEVAVISAGRKNRFGHPTQEVLERLAATGTEIFRTDRDGDIQIRSDGTRHGLMRE